MSAQNLQVVERLVDSLTREEQLTLIERLAARLKKTVNSAPPKNLYGIWRDRFPVEFDVDAALAQIRRSWESEWNPNNGN